MSENKYWHGYNGDNHDDLRTERVTLEITLPLWGWKCKAGHPAHWDWERICEIGDGLGDCASSRPFVVVAGGDEK